MIMGILYSFIELAKELKKHTSLTILTNEEFVAYREERNNRNMIKRDGVEDFTDIPF